MLRYRLLNVEKMGKQNYYTLEDLQRRSYIKITLKELKPILEANEVVNANWKSKVVETPDVAINLRILPKSLAGNSTVWVLERRDKAAPEWVYYRFFNHQGLDITGAIYGSTKGDWNIKLNNFLSVRIESNDMAKVIVDRINGYARDLGILPPISNIERLQRLPKNRSSNFNR